jgi:phosphatidylglycerophosphate synthase
VSAAIRQFWCFTPHDTIPELTANQITFARALLVAGLASLVSRPATPTLAWSVVLIATVAALLDGVDGWVARRTGTVSAFGSRFDMETDAALILVLAILVWSYGKAGPWVLLSGLLRYLFVAAGWLWPWMRAPLASSVRGKVICVVQIAALIVAMVPTISPPASSLVAAGALLALSYSFVVDTLRLRWRTQ